MERRSRGLLLGFMLLASWAPPAAWAQYEKYSFRGFPESELMPLQSAYSYALEQYEGEHWKESVRYLEASLRLHRLLRDSEAHCHKECAKPGQGGAPLGEPLRGAGLGEALQRAGLGEVAQGARQGAPLGEPPQGALLGKPSQGANGEFGQGKEPVQGAPLGEPSQGARLGEPPQGARLGKSRQGSEFGEPSQGARLGEPAQGTPGELGQGAQPLQDARLGEVWQGTETSPGAQQQQLQQQDARLGEPPWVPPDEWLGEMEVFGRILQRASCLRRCKHSLPVFQLSYPPADTLRLFQRRAPYQYLHYALFKTNKIEKAVSAAHTFLQKNPKHEMTQRYLNYYKTMVDVDEYLVDLEAQQYETVFVRAVKLYNSGDFRSSIADMEYALAEYYKAYKNCLFGCEGSYELREFKDFYPAIADHFINVLQCKVDCEADLTPNVGGYFVEKFVATMYHYLQFAYYKLNDIKNAVQSVASYMLFDPGDEVMQQNLVYYRFYRERWHLEEDDFNPRPEALSYHDQTSTQKKLLEFAKQYLQPDDETEVGDGEETGGPALPTDEEFEGIGDYEEGFLAQWWQEPKSKGDKADEALMNGIVPAMSAASEGTS